MVRPSAKPMWFGVGVHQTTWILYRGVIHHPAPRASACGILLLEGAWYDTFHF